MDEEFANVRGLVAPVVIEVEDHDVRLAAVEPWMLDEVCEHAPSVRVAAPTRAVGAGWLCRSFVRV